MLAALVIAGALGQPGSRILAISYDPPLRARRIAPPSIRRVADLAEVAGLAVEIARLTAALPVTDKGPTR